MEQGLHPCLGSQELLRGVPRLRTGPQQIGFPQGSKAPKGRANTPWSLGRAFLVQPALVASTAILPGLETPFIYLDSRQNQRGFGICPHTCTQALGIGSPGF